MAKLARLPLALLGEDQTGATVVEYALLLLLGAVITIAVVGLLGNNLSNFFASASSSI